MGTKSDPGAFDCYAKAEPDEPLFVLLARDWRAPHLVRLWAALEAQDVHDTIRIFAEMSEAALGHFDYSEEGVAKRDAKTREAADCADAMELWSAAHALRS